MMRDKDSRDLHSFLDREFVRDIESARNFVQVRGCVCCSVFCSVFSGVSSRSTLKPREISCRCVNMYMDIDVFMYTYHPQIFISMYIHMDMYTHT